MPKRTRDHTPRDQIAADTPRTADRDGVDRAVPLYRRLPWTATVVSLGVLIAGGLAVPPIQEATLLEVTAASLVRSPTYVLVAPLSNVLDLLTLISVKQHIALFVGVLVLFAVWRVVRWRMARVRPRSHAIAFALLLVAIVVAYVAAAVLPRPMASLVTLNANLLRVDFHSHTSASHDGRPGWTPERNRAWHRDAGFDVAYITDHASVTGAEQAVARNPSPAGDGVTLLQAIETTWTGEHVAILGAQRTYSGILTANLRDVDVQGLTLASLVQGREPLVIWNHPRQLDRLPIASGPRTMGVRAIEIVNGAPDDMDELRPKRAAIVTLADQRNLALTSGSDNHGWGRAAPAWTLVPVFGWSGMDGDVLAREIENVLRSRGFDGTVVVERRVADPGDSDLALALTVFAAPARMLTTLSNAERVSWLAWTWLAMGIVWWLRRRRARALTS